ncbi:RHS repeat domain-containing protein [Acinetobacter dispersus]|uniref:RHS repeat domain-containing protein n=1 Tax=Acinetobacter dispersus TaxID=70348 RepID=UPI003C2D6A9B
MNLLLKKVVFLWLWLIWVTVSSAATDYTALTNNLAALPGIKSQTQGYDFLSGKVTQSIPLVKGPIPFTMQYHASLRLSSDGGVDYYQELDEGAVADWSNEYSGYIITNPTPGTNGERAFIIQLPGNSEKHIIAYMGGKWKRIYYAGSGAAPAQTFTSEDLRDISFSETNGVVTIIKDGVTYTAGISKTLNSFGKTDKLLKFTSIKFQDGKVLTLSYDNGINLIEVKDNRNNLLKILREYKKAGATSQSSLERKLITGVELKSGSDTQKSTISYQEVQVQSITDLSKQETRYTLVGIQSLVAGNFSYQYNNLLRGYLYKYLFNNVSGRTQAQLVAASTYPMLVKILDEKNNSLRQWDYGNIVDVYTGTGNFSVYVTQISAFSMVNGTVVNKSISAYDDLRSTFTNRFVVNGQEQTVDISIDSSKLGNYYNEANLGLMANATATVALSGDFPSVMNGSVPVRSVTFNPFTHRIVSIKDFNGNTSKYDYDSLNRLSKSTLALDSVDSQITTYNYTTLSNGAVNRFPTPNEIITDSQKVANTLDLNGWISQQVISYPKGGTAKTIQYTYYTDSLKVDYGLLKNVDGPRTDVNDNVSITYDNYGNKLTTTQTVNNKIVITKHLNYNSFGQPERIVFPSGIVDQYVYNLDGTLKSKTTGSGSESGNVVGTTYSFTYDYLKRKKSETNPDNEMTLYDYDTLGRLIKKIDSDGRATTQTYFDTGEIQVVDSGSSIILNEINPSGRIFKKRNGTDSNYYWKTFTYDGNGNITQTQTALGIIEKWTYDALNRNTTHTDGEGYTSTIVFDKSNNKVSEKDAGNVGSSPYTYVSSTLVKDETNDDFGKKSYEYNLSDQLISKSHGSRTCTNSNIDSLGRVGAISCTNENGIDQALAYNYQYTYDSSRFGRLDKISSTSPFGVETQYTYDDYDRVTGKTQTNKSLTTWNGVNASLSISYTYTAAGKVKAITMPSGRSVGYNYDGTKGRLASINIAGNPFISSIAYDSLGQLTSWNILNTNASYIVGYDSAKNGAIKSVSFNNKSNIALYREQYEFDKDGRIVTVNQLNNSNSYLYDNANRLTGEKSIIYSYSVTGNRVKLNDNRYGYDPSTNRLSIVRDYDYDTIMNTSNLATGEVRNRDFLAVYDGNGQMRYSGGANVQYYMAYNHKNERTVRSINTSGNWYTGATQYLYDENSNLVGEYTPNGIPIVEYVWMGSRPVAAIYGSGNNTKIYTIITDRNNTPRMLVDISNDTIVWQWQSTAFGVGKPIGNIIFNLRFPGQYYDEYTGLHYNINRYYNPELGLYMEPDPIGLEGGLNPYIYADNNPISNIDPSGLDCIGGTCSSGFEQGMYDWWPGYKFGTGLYNSWNSGYLNFSIWEGLDAFSVMSFGGARGLQYADDAAETAKNVWQRMYNFPKLSPEVKPVREFSELYGPFHRMGDSMESIQSIKGSQQIFGNPPTNFYASDIAKVKAYQGQLPAGKQGFEFYTPVKPNGGGMDGRALWFSPNPGVKIVQDKAVIRCIVTKIGC